MPVMAVGSVVAMMQASACSKWKFQFHSVRKRFPGVILKQTRCYDFLRIPH